MGLFTPDDEREIPGVRKGGFARYREVLEGGWKGFFMVGFITLVFLIPFAGGMVYAVLSKSALIALVSGLIGGMIAGPGLACMYDNVLRRLRNDRSDWWTCWKKALRQNWRAAILPGVVEFVFLGMVIFSGALMLWGATPPSLGTIGLLLVGSLLLFMVLAAWWPQVVLFTQKPLIQLKNSVFFALFHLGRVFCAALLRVLWWLILFFFLPWTAFVVPILGVWYILFLSVFMIYRHLDDDFKVEEQIREAFPGTLPEGDDE